MIDSPLVVRHALASERASEWRAATAMETVMLTRFKCFDIAMQREALQDSKPT